MGIIKKVINSLIFILAFFLLINQASAYSGKCASDITNIPYDLSTWPNGTCEVGRTEAIPEGSLIWPQPGKTVSWKCLGSTSSEDVLCTGSRAVASAITLPTCSFTYGAASIYSGGGAFIHWDFTGADKVTFRCSNYACSNNICTLNSAGRTQYGDNFLSSAPIKSEWGDGLNIKNTWIGAGTETCTFTAENSKGKVTCADTLEIRPTNSLVGICGDESGKIYDYDSITTSGKFETKSFCKSGAIRKITVENVAYDGAEPPFFPNNSFEVSWSCGGGSIEEVNCGVSRIKNTRIIDGSCGVANGTYANEASAFRSPQSFCSESQKFCASGKVVPDYSTIRFPEIGKAVSWICQGYNNGKNAACSASHGTVNNTEGACGSANEKVYTNNEDFGNDTFCTSGSAVPARPQWMPNPQAFFYDASWTCGQGSGMKNCSAHKQRSSSCGAEAGKKYPAEAKFFDTNNFCADKYEVVTAPIAPPAEWKCKPSSWLKNVFNWLTNNNSETTCISSTVPGGGNEDNDKVGCGEASKKLYPLETLQVPIIDGLCTENGLHGVSEPPKFGVDPTKPNEASWNCINKESPSDIISCTANRGEDEEDEEEEEELPEAVNNLCGPALGSARNGNIGTFGSSLANKSMTGLAFCSGIAEIVGVAPETYPAAGGEKNWTCKKIGATNNITAICTIKVNSFSDIPNPEADIACENKLISACTQGNKPEITLVRQVDSNDCKVYCEEKIKFAGCWINAQDGCYCRPGGISITQLVGMQTEGGNCTVAAPVERTTPTIPPTVPTVPTTPTTPIDPTVSITNPIIPTNPVAMGTTVSDSKNNTEKDSLKAKCGDAQGIYYFNENKFRGSFCKTGSPEMAQSDRYAYGPGQDWKLNGVNFFLNLKDTGRMATSMQWTCVGSESKYNSGLCRATLLSIPEGKDCSCAAQTCSDKTCGGYARGETDFMNDYCKGTKECVYGKCGNAAGFYDKEQRQSGFTGRTFCESGIPEFYNEEPVVTTITNYRDTSQFPFPVLGTRGRTKWTCLGSEEKYNSDICAASVIYHEESVWRKVGDAGKQAVITAAVVAAVSFIPGVAPALLL